MGKEFSSASISRFASTLDDELDCWRERSFTKEYPYVVVDARYESCRVDGKIIDIACLVALGIDSEGYRHVLGVDTSWSESNNSWDRFIVGLKNRGLQGVRLFTSDDHPGIHHAIKKQVVFQLVCLGWQVFIEVLHLKITLFYSIFWITKTIQLIVK